MARDAATEWLAGEDRRAEPVGGARPSMRWRAVALFEHRGQGRPRASILVVLTSYASVRPGSPKPGRVSYVARFITRRSAQVAHLRPPLTDDRALVYHP